MFDFQHITEYQLSITNYCNAACPQCPRNINGGNTNPYMPLRHLPRTVIDQAFDTELVSRLTQIFFCGGFGEPTMHPDFLNILRDFRNKRSDLWLYMHTNGGTHTAEWWQELADIIGPYGKVDFGIDGLEDTNHLYRRNVNWSTVMNNATAFIQAGGKAQWNFIMFRHNQHQVDLAQSLSQHMGFVDFLPRKTGRFYNHSTVDIIDQWPVQNRRGEIEYYLEPSDLPQAQNTSLHRIEWIKQQPGGWKNYHNTTPIKCDALAGNKVVITADGLVLPCNFFEHHLYDARYHDPVYLPGSHNLAKFKGRNHIQNIVQSAGTDININHHSLQEIFKNPMWDEIVGSWSKTLEQGRIYECANTCGEKFTKVWDQGGSKR